MTDTYCMVSRVLTCIHMHTQTHRTMAVIPCLQPQGLRNGPCPLYTGILPPTPRQYPVPYPTDLIYHCRLDCWEPQTHVGTTETPKYGARTPKGLAFPRRSLWFWGSVGTVAERCRELISQVQKRPLAPKYLPSEEIPPHTPL